MLGEFGDNEEEKFWVFFIQNGRELAPDLSPYILSFKLTKKKKKKIMKKLKKVCVVQTVECALHVRYLPTFYTVHIQKMLCYYYVEKIAN